MAGERNPEVSPEEVDAIIERLAWKRLTVDSLLDDPEFMLVPVRRASEITQRWLELRQQGEGA